MAHVPTSPQGTGTLSKALPKPDILPKGQSPDAPATVSPRQEPAQRAAASRATYRSLCLNETAIPIFSRAWWLDAVAGEQGWDVALVEKDGQVIASMPYCRTRKLGFWLIVHPPFTQTMGPWIRRRHTCQMKQLSEEKKLMSALIAQLPAFDYFEQRWHYSNTNWLPFYWAGFQQTTRYTYVINDISNPEAVFEQFSEGKRQDLKKAQRNLTVKFHIPAREFYDHHVRTLGQRNAKILYSRDLFDRIYAEGYKHGAACSLGAYDAQGTLHAAIFVIWDENSAYALINTIDQTLKSSGASTLLLRESIRHVSRLTRKFDFEGSMIPSVESSVRQFNSRQTPYFSVMKTTSPLYPLLRLLKTRLRWNP